MFSTYRRFREMAVSLEDAKKSPRKRGAMCFDSTKY